MTSSQQVICTQPQGATYMEQPCYVQAVLSVEKILPFFSLKQTLIILQDSSHFISPINPFLASRLLTSNGQGLHYLFMGSEPSNICHSMM